MKVVIKIGGSIFSGSNSTFLKKLTSGILGWNKKHEVAIVVGGGEISRKFGKLGKELTSNEDLLDRIGIFAARLNASILVAALDDKACPEIPRSEYEFMDLLRIYPKKIMVAGGFRPEQRTDAVSMEIAKVWNADLFIKCTDVDYVYDKDPKRSKAAKPIKRISTNKLKELTLVEKHEANKPTIMDAVAARILVETGIKAVVLNGKNLTNIGNVLAGKRSRGTKIGF